MRLALYIKWTIKKKNSRMISGILRMKWRLPWRKAVLFFDIDGTILSARRRGSIPESAVNGAAEGEKRRGICSLSIRAGQSAASRLRSGGMPFDGFLCGCGTHLFFHEEELLAKSLPRETGQGDHRQSYLSAIWAAIAEGPEDVYFPSRISTI